MAKSSKAKAKLAKTARPKKTKTAAKTMKAKTAAKTTKAKTPAKTVVTGASDTDPCAAQQQAFDDAQLVVDNLTNEIDDPDIPPKERLKAQRDLQTANNKLSMARRALEQCKRQQP